MKRFCGNKRGISEHIVIFLLAIIFCVIIIFLISERTAWGQTMLNHFTNDLENKEEIFYKCKDACIDVEEGLFCEKERKLNLGADTLIVGTCFEISQLGIEGGVSPCDSFRTCPGSESAVCYKDNKKIDCNLLK